VGYNACFFRLLNEVDCWNGVAFSSDVEGFASSITSVGSVTLVLEVWIRKIAPSMRMMAAIREIVFFFILKGGRSTGKCSLRG